MDRWCDYADGYDVTGATAWASGQEYTEGMRRSNGTAPNAALYEVHTAHTSSSANEPGVSDGELEPWRTYWFEVADGTMDYPYKTITDACKGLTGGDNVKVAETAAATALAGTAVFTEYSQTVTVNADLTGAVAAGDFIGNVDIGWWEIQSTSFGATTTITLVGRWSCYGTPAAGYSIEKLNPQVTTGGTGTHQTVSTWGVSPTAMLTVSGGWNRTTGLQTGRTVFKTDGSANQGTGLATSGNNVFLHIKDLVFVNYQSGVVFSGSNTKSGVRITDITTIRCRIYGDQSSDVYIEDCKSYYTTAEAFRFWLFATAYVRNCIVLSCRSNMFQFAEVGAWSVIDCYGKGDGNANPNYINVSGSGYVKNFTGHMGANLGTALYVASGTVWVDNMVSGAVNIVHDVRGKLHLRNCTFPAGRSRTVRYGGVITAEGCTNVPSLSDTIPATDVNGWGTIVGTTAEGERHTESGYAWKMTPLAQARVDDWYVKPLAFPIAKIPVTTGNTYTVRAWMKKSHATAITARLRCRAEGQIGIAVDATGAATDTTDWQQVSVSVTPTVSTVLEFHAECWGGDNAYSVIVDDVSVSAS